MRIRAPLFSQDDSCGFGARPRRLLNTRRFVCWQAVNLRRVKHGVVLENTHLFLGVLRFVVLDLIWLREKDRRGLFALANLPVLFMGLLIGHPARIAGLERPHVHAEDQDIDAVIAPSRCGIERSLRAARFLRVPWAYPWLYAALKLGDDTVCELLNGIAMRGIGHCLRPPRPGEMPNSVGGVKMSRSRN